MRAPRAALAALALALVAAACVPVAPAPPAAPSVIMYGDSLSLEARAHFAARFAGSGLEVVEHIYGGVALCDWLAQITDDMANLEPRAVVLQFAGNNLTPCMAGIGDIPAKYAADLDDAFDRLAGRVDPASVFVVAAPPNQMTDGVALNAAMQATTAARGGTWVPEATAAVTDAGAFAWDLPCLPDETRAQGCRVDGRIVVRAPDGGHFCPVKAPFACPPVYSSGARRFGEAMGDAVRTGLGH